MEIDHVFITCVLHSLSLVALTRRDDQRIEIKLILELKIVIVIGRNQMDFKKH